MPVTSTLGALTYTKITLGDPNLSYWLMRVENTSNVGTSSVPFVKNIKVINDNIIVPYVTGIVSGNASNYYNNFIKIGDTINPVIDYSKQYRLSNSASFTWYDSNTFISNNTSYGNSGGYIDTDLSRGYAVFDIETGNLCNLGNTFGFGIQSLANNISIQGYYEGTTWIGALLPIITTTQLETSNTTSQSIIGLNSFTDPVPTTYLTVKAGGLAISPIYVEAAYTFCLKDANSGNKANSFIFCRTSSTTFNFIESSWDDMANVISKVTLTAPATYNVKDVQCVNVNDANSNFFATTNRTVHKFLSNSNVAWTRTVSTSNANILGVSVIDGNQVLLSGTAFTSNGNKYVGFITLMNQGNISWQRSVSLTLNGSNVNVNSFSANYFDNNIFVSYNYYSNANNVATYGNIIDVLKLPGNGAILGNGVYTVPMPTYKNNPVLTYSNTNIITFTSTSWTSANYTLPSLYQWYGNGLTTPNLNPNASNTTTYYRTNLNP